MGPGLTAPHRVGHVAARAGAQVYNQWLQIKDPDSGLHVYLVRAPPQHHIWRGQMAS